MSKKVILIYDGREFEIGDGEFSVGRGQVFVQIPDQSLSRHHATVFRQDERIWILDNNSLNGTFVNGAEAAPNGTPLKNGDEIGLGEHITLQIKIVQPQTATAAKTAAPTKSVVTEEKSGSGIGLAPMLVAAFAVTVIGLAILVVAARTILVKDEPVVAESNNTLAGNSSDDDEDEDSKEKTNRRKPENKNENSNSGASPTPNANPTPDAPIGTNDPKPREIIVPNKTYLQMSDAEKRQFIEREAVIVARMVGKTGGDVPPPEAIDRIKGFVDAFAKRINNPKLPGDCNFTKADLQTLLERASKNAPFIVRAFNSESIAPQVGLYLAMIESEHCVCLQSPTGPLGMFQFTRATGASFGLETKVGASPTNPDERCQPERAAPAAAKYMKFLAGRYGTGALSVPLAIASYNSGEGGLSKNLQEALAAEAGQERSFWTLVANQGKLSEQFKKENIKYVPKFFAAAIVGENPTVFGVKLPPVSSNTK